MFLNFDDECNKHLMSTSYMPGILFNIEYIVANMLSSWQNFEIPFLLPHQ